MRACIEDGCGEAVSGLRSRRCDDHKRLRRNAQERARYHRDQQLERSNDGRARLYAQDEASELLLLIDYTRQGAKPGIARETMTTPYAPRPTEPAAHEVVIDYTKGGRGPASIYARPAQGGHVPASARHDYSRYQRDQAMAEKPGQQEDQGIVPWADLTATAAAYGGSGARTVVFDKGPSDYEPARYDYLGRPAARNRGRGRNGLR
jgi:hypothetical protein